jgi:plastocyanin
MAVGKIARQSIEEGTKSHIDVLDFFEDIDGDALYYYAEWDQEGKIAFDNLDSNPLNSWFDLYPDDPNFYGFVQVVFVVYDRDPLDPDYDDVRLDARQSAIWEVKNVNDAPRLDAWTPDYNPEIQELEEQTFTIVSIYDVDSTTFRYKWFVDDVEQVEWAGSFFTFTTSYESAGTYRIRCEVKDNLGEPANTMPEWTLTVKNTNRDPTVNLRTRDSTLDEGERITLQADGYDQDGDSLTYTWYEVAPDGREREVGLGANFQMKTPLAAGVYKYKCQVDDGNSKQWSDEVLVTVTAKEFPAVLPGFGTFGAIAALGAAVGAAMLVRPRRH